METVYSLAWKDYKKSNDYKRAVKVMENKGMTQPYIDNILNGAFNAGYNCTKTPTP